MLSKLSKYVMGLLHKRPMNPYELTKLSDMEVIQSWFPMTSASLYTTIKNLEKKGYITGETLQESNYPAKTKYYLTEKGRQVLLEDLAEGLASFEAEASNFGIGIFHICSLSKGEALLKAEERLAFLKKLHSDSQDSITKYLDKIPFNMMMMLRYKLNRIAMEISTTESLIEAIKKEEKWEYSFTQYL